MDTIQATDQITNASTPLCADICQIIEQARHSVAITANAQLTMMYWHIGQRINKEVLVGSRATYGKREIDTLAEQLCAVYPGAAFEAKNLRRMIKFASLFPNEEIVAPLARQLSWSHFLEVLPLKDELQREFYLTMAAAERWSKRTLRDKIDGMLYERMAISGKPSDFIKHELAELRDNQNLSPDLVFKSPYFLDFTGLKGYYSERSLEDMLIVGLQQFLMELGNGFTFIERQKRIVIDGEDFYIDLLFYHRKLHRLIAIELKRGRFKAAYKGQVELYLRYLDKYEREAGEESPLGLILCSEGSEEQIELLQLDQAGIKVAQYYTELPQKEVLREQLRKQIERAKLHIAEEQN